MSQKIRDLIKNKDYDHISVRVTAPEGFKEEDIFFGICHSEGGELISDDGDSYDPDEEVLRFEEWENEKRNIKSGLTVVLKGHWITQEEFHASSLS